MQEGYDLWTGAFGVKTADATTLGLGLGLGYADGASVFHVWRVLLRVTSFTLYPSPTGIVFFNLTYLSRVCHKVKSSRVCPRTRIYTQLIYLMYSWEAQTTNFTLTSRRLSCVLLGDERRLSWFTIYEQPWTLSPVACLSPVTCLYLSS